MPEEGPEGTVEVVEQEVAPEAEPEEALEDPLGGIPDQQLLDVQALRGALFEARKSLAVSKVNWHIAAKIGVEGVHASRVKEDIGKLTKQVELLEGLLGSGELPLPPKLEIATLAAVPSESA